MEQIEEDCREAIATRPAPQSTAWIDPFGDETMLALIVEIKRLRDAFLDYAGHQSWRCDYRERYEKCRCGLDELMNGMDLERIAPNDPEADRG